MRDGAEATTRPARGLAEVLFGRGVLPRRPYILVGLVLLALKYAGEAAAVFATTGRLWPVGEFLFPSVANRSAMFGEQSTVALMLLLIWSIPFIVLATWLSARRAIDAGMSGLLALLLFVPFLSLGVIALLCIAPSSSRTHAAPEPREDRGDATERSVVAVLAGSVVGMGFFLLSVYVLGNYGLALMLGTPILVGLVVASLSGKEGDRDIKTTLVTCLILCAMLVIPGFEGLICIAMALVPMIILAMVGVVLARAVASSGSERARTNASWSLLLLPTLVASDGLGETSPELRVTSSIEIAAPIERVWDCVVEFSDLPEPEEWIFRLGIAYPQRAEIRGRGVGAVRHCVFSTGAFVEPITVWNEPTHLAFDVAQQPDPMRELSPYAHVHPPHLSGGFRSKRGEFRLERLSATRTRVHGTTWYELEVRPRSYWMLWTDGLIHAIHQRVLEHIRREAEKAEPAQKR